MASSQQRIPATLSLITFLWRSRFEHTFLLSIQTSDVPRVAPSDRLKIQELTPNAHRVVASYGFMESPDATGVALQAAEQLQLDIAPNAIVYIIGHETIVPSSEGRMGDLQERLFAFLARNAEPATRWYRLPARQVLEIGAQYDL
jgi:KUP system potassium uptake protein